MGITKLRGNLFNDVIWKAIEGGAALDIQF